MAFAFKPAAANTIAVQLGIDHLLSGYIIQSESITENVENLEIPDQKGRVAQVIAYDKSYDCSLQVIGPVASMTYNAGTTLSWYDANGTACNYIIQSVQLNCTYNDTAKYTITMRAWPHASYSDKTEDSL
jgi:hypothetical protein